MGDKNVFYFSVAGKSNSGKTGLVEKIVKELKSRNLKIATIKHTKGDHTIDEKGKDTWKHRKAGSDLVIFSTPSETSFIHDRKLGLDEILDNVNGEDEYDAVVIEGMKDVDMPKVTMGDSDIDSEICYDENLDEIIEWIEKNIELTEILNSLPRLDCGKCEYDSCREMAESILEGKNVIEDCEKLDVDVIDLKINGETVPLSKFPSNLVEGGIIGMLKSLKGVKDINKVEISFEHSEEKKDKR